MPERSLCPELRATTKVDVLQFEQPVLYARRPLSLTCYAGLQITARQPLNASKARFRVEIECFFDVFF